MFLDSPCESLRFEEREERREGGFCEKSRGARDYLVCIYSRNSAAARTKFVLLGAPQASAILIDGIRAEAQLTRGAAAAARGMTLFSLVAACLPARVPCKSRRAHFT